MKAVDKLRVPVRLLARPLTSEPPRVKEPVRVLESEECSPKLEVELKEPARLLARPLTSELARPNEPVSDLCSEP